MGDPHSTLRRLLLHQPEKPRLGNISDLVLLNLIITIVLNQISKDLAFYSLIVLCGGVGSLFSVALNLNKINIDTDAPWGIHTVSGGSRIVIGMVGAIFTYLLVKSNLVLGLISQANSDYAIYAICTVAGFSETLVPNILKKIESQQE